MLKDANTVVEDATKALRMRQADVETASATFAEASGCGEWGPHEVLTASAS